VRESGEFVEIGGSDARKIRRVLRLRDGEAIEVIDSAGTAFEAAIVIDGTQVRARLGNRRNGVTNAGETGVRFDVAQALPKGQKMDFIVEKLTELGVENVLPFVSERTVAGVPAAPKIERWRRIATTAARQCGRNSIPRIRPPLAAFDALLDSFKDYDAVAFAWELAPQIPLRDRLPRLLKEATRALLVVGPEGGFTHEEAEGARSRGAALVWMGPRILRAETAGVVLLAVADALAQGRNRGRARRTGVS